MMRDATVSGGYYSFIAQAKKKRCQFCSLNQVRKGSLAQEDLLWLTVHFGTMSECSIFSDGKVREETSLCKPLEMC